MWRAVFSLLVLIASSCAMSGRVATTEAPEVPLEAIPAAPFSSVAGDLDFDGLMYEKIAEVDFPIQVVARPGEEVAYVLTKGGLVYALADDRLGDAPVLDLSRKVGQAREQGLLSMLLSDDGDLAYVSYTAANGDTVLSEFGFDEDGIRIDSDSERVMFRLGQPAKNHNGGMLQMSEGRIFLSLGDGGGAGDTFGNAQNVDNFYGGIITVSPTGDPSPSLFAYGLRNPWRFWIDSGLLYVADVGQDSFEEINVVRLEPGQNFGWPITEGRHCYRPAEHCDATGTVFPVLELEHGDDGACSITGGVVYRGFEIPELDGFYLYSDFCGGFLRGLRHLGDGEIETEDWTDSAGVPGSVSGFGLDGRGEVYIATVDAIYRIVADR